MIASLTGILAAVGDDRIHLQVGPILYELLVPANDLNLLQAGVGEEMTFHTHFYLQGDASGGQIEPRLVGFLRREDKKFFEKFITVKGIGPRKALKALALPVGEIAHAIESKDARALTELPEIGKRTAEQIIAELSGKVQAFAVSLATSRTPTRPSRRTSEEEDAIQVLIALGERRLDAEQLLERVKQTHPEATTPDALSREMLRLRTVRA
jgi:Holliday junction DNA helicase RuvA